MNVNIVNHNHPSSDLTRKAHVGRVNRKQTLPKKVER